MFNLSYKTHTRFVYHITDLRHVNVTLQLRFINFCKTLVYSENPLVRNVTDHAFTNNLSQTGLNLLRILIEIDICSSESYFTYKANVYNMIVNSYEKQVILNEEEMNFCMIVKELTDCAQNIKQCGLCYDDMKYIVDTVCTL